MKPVAVYMALALLASGCGKGFLDVNDNPNAPVNGAPALLFTNALASTAAIVNGDDFFTLNYPLCYEALNSDYQVAYTITRNGYTSSDFTCVWTDIYHNLNDYLQVEKGGAPFLAAASKVMEALDYQMLVDGYNDIPYAQALQLGSGITHPGYDRGQAVYDACIAKLDTAIGLLESDSVQAGGAYNPGSADILFGGAPNAWAQLANTIKLRMLLHEAAVAPSAVRTEAARIAADPNGCLSRTAFINPGYATDASQHLSPLWSTMGYTITGALANPDQSPNTYFIDKLGAYGDPRVGFFYCCSPFTGQPSGNPFGIPTNTGATYVGSGPTATPPYNVPAPVSTWGILQGPAQASILVAAWESLFLQAEAVYRGLLPGGDAVAEADYEAAITEDFVYLQVYTDGNTTGDPAGFARAYFTQNIPDVGWAASPDKFRAIITQKYISLCFTNVEEAWTDYRRTGFPADLPLSTDPGALYPRVLRFVYPQSEYETNAASVAKEGAVTPVSPKIFWMP